jgi:hypothetical protein
MDFSADLDILIAAAMKMTRGHSTKSWLATA